MCGPGDGAPPVEERRLQLQAYNGTAAISELSGAVGLGEMLAIMGPSGGGKSTLLDILAGRKSLGTLRGSVEIGAQDGAPPVVCEAARAAASLRAMSCYIPQEVAFMPMQTAEEAVWFYADLKLGRDERGDAVRERRVRSVLQEVGLSVEASKRPISGVLPGGVTIRGLSGGERKRLALACALATKPSLLLIDELTSGLDSVNALVVMCLLRRLCSLHRVAAITVIHQPSPTVFSLFDGLVLLTKGAPIFSGKLTALPEFYKTRASVRRCRRRRSSPTTSFALPLQRWRFRWRAAGCR